MKNWLIHILYMGIAALTFASCTQDELIPMPDEDKMQVIFTLALGDSSLRSRAAWNDNQGGTDATIGDSFDNEIGLNQLQVALYNKDGSFMGKVNDLQYYQTDQINVYQFVGNLSMNTQRELDCKIMVFANLGENNIISESTDLSQLSFPYNSQYIPMWGVSSINVTVTPGKRTTLQEPIYLLRAMAKVEVTLDNTLMTSGYNLENVILENYNTSGYCLPKGYADVSSTEQLDRENVFNVVSPPSDKEQTLPFQQNEDKSYTLYVPEYQNVGVNTASCMKVTIKSKVYTLDFKDYKTGKGFNLIRNHYYKFNITGVGNENLDLTIQYKVSDWENKGNHDITFN